MSFLKDAQSAVEFATNYPLLYKATADNSTSTDGYLYEEISKISYISHQHRINLIDFLLGKLATSGWSGKQKVIRILQHLCQKGHCGIRMLLRQRDGEIRNIASQGVSPDPVLSNTPQLFFNSAVQELLGIIFDPTMMKADEELLIKGGENLQQKSVLSNQGYGSSGGAGKYEGFGNAPLNKPETIVDQIMGAVEKLALPSEERRIEEIKSILKSDKGNYKPFQSPHLVASVIPSSDASQLLSSKHSLSGLSMYASTQRYSKGHVTGKAGGGWDSDEEDMESLNPPSSFVAPPSVSSLEKDATLEEEFMDRLVHQYTSWPVNYDHFLSMCRQCSILRPDYLLNYLYEKMSCFINSLSSSKSDSSVDQLPVGSFEKLNIALLIVLLFIECSINEGLLPVCSLKEYLAEILTMISKHSNLDQKVSLKAEKLCLIIDKLVALLNS